MRKKLAKRYVESSMPVRVIMGIVLSCAIGFFVSFLLSVLFSYILSKSPEITNFIGIYFIISVLSGSFVSGFIGSKVLYFKGIVSGLICSVFYSILVLSVMLFTSDGNLSITFILLFIFIVFSSVIGGVTSANLKRRK